MLLIVVAAAIAYVGVLAAASRQVTAVRLATDQQVSSTRRGTDHLVSAIRRATDQQVAAVRRATGEQVASLQAEREQTERQPVEWNVQIREGRIEIAAVTRGNVSPAGQREAPSPIARLVVESEPSPHQERAEMALLDDRMRAVFEELASLIDEYNSRTKTINRLAALARIVEPIEP